MSWVFTIVAIIGAIVSVYFAFKREEYEHETECLRQLNQAQVHPGSEPPAPRDP